MFQFDILGDKELVAKLEKMPFEVADTVVGEVQDYLLNVLRSDQPPPKYVTRKAAYGQTFSSEKQRRWFFANLADGSINVPYRRTQGLSRGWQITDKGLAGYIVNPTPGAKFVIGDKTQSRHEKMVGWKTVGQQLKDRAGKIGKVIEAAAKKALRKLRL